MPDTIAAGMICGWHVGLHRGPNRYPVVITDEEEEDDEGGGTEGVADDWVD